MTTDQFTLFVILAATLAMFIWNRWRYDVVALGALMVTTVLGLVPAEGVFAGFGHPAVVTVAAVLVLSRSLQNNGVVESIARYLARVGNRPTLQVAALTVLVAVCSAFMNNVGALALLMPVAIWVARQSGRSPSLLLMPLAFGSLLGGMTTLIGTPPNIIIANYRVQTGAPPFAMFDFLPVGGGVALAGVLFISLIGWRLTPRREARIAPGDLFKISDYLSEVRVPEDSKVVGRTIHDLLTMLKDQADVAVVGLVGAQQRLLAPSTYEVLHEGDILVVEADSESLDRLLGAAGLELAAHGDDESDTLEAGDVRVVEAVVTPEAPILGETATSLNLREHHDVNLLAVARRGHRVKRRLGRVRFQAGDILLVQGRERSLQAALGKLGCLPLAERGFRIGRPRRGLLALGIFAAGLVLVTFEVLPAPVALICAAVSSVVAGLLSPAEAYRAIDWAVIVLLGALIPVAGAIETTGGSQLIADQLLALSGSAPPVVTLAILLVGTMALSDVVNNAAAALLTAPIAVGVAEGMGACADPFLMAVAIGASCAFLTPIGHQSSALVMAPGGYRFGDYFRLGLPLEVVVVVTAIPLLMRFWPM